MAFSFRLQSLLNYRRSLEDLAQIRLTEQLQALALQEDRIGHLTRLREDCQQAFQQKTGEPAPVKELVFYLDFQDRSYEQLSRLEEGREKILSEVQRERDRLIVLTKDRKILEKLKERQEKEFLRDLDRKERKQIEDLVVQRYAGSKKGA
ncbi:MAG: flagellar export protein FliJ [Deltaproteobacteria bacterium]|nr:flagellar export protein FliJ [Deltaproteobacteria bacterium]